MNTHQRIALLQRRTAEDVALLEAWLARDGARAGVATRALAGVLSRAERGQEVLRAALARPPVVGVVPADPRATEGFVGRLLERSARESRPQVTRHPRVLTTQLLARVGDGTAATALRLTAGAAPPPTDGHSVQLRLMSFTDAAYVLAQAAAWVWPEDLARPLDLGALRQLYADVGRSISTARTPGVSSRDIHALRERIEAAWPDAPFVRELAAHGYWSDLADVVGHLPAAARISALSLLWGARPELTARATLLNDALSRLGYAVEVSCTSDTLLGSGFAAPPLGTSSAMVRLGCAADDVVQTVGRLGHRSTVSRAALSVLVLEVVLPGAGPPLPRQPTADLVVFPPVPVRDAPSRGARDGAIGPALVRGKADVVLGAAIGTQDVTALVTVVGPATAGDDTLVEPIAAWIDRTQGTTPEARESAPTGIFVVAPASLAQHASSPRDAAADAVAAAIVGGIGADQAWPREWTPGEAFSNVHWYDDGGRSPVLEPSRPLRLDPTAPEEAGAASRPAIVERRWPLSLARFAAEAHPARWASDGGIDAIADAVAAVCRPEDRADQIRRRLAGIRRDLRARLLRRGANSDAGEVAALRHRAAVALQTRLRSGARAGRLGVVLASLSLRPGEARALAGKAARHEGGDVAGWQTVAPDGTGSELDMDQRFAADVIAYWCAALQSRVQCPSLARAAGIPERYLSDLADEVALAAERCDLVHELALELGRGRSDGWVAASPAALAATASMFVSTFLERLAVPGATGAARARIEHQPIARSPLALRSAVDPRTPPPPLSRIWPDGLRTLVDANAAPGLVRPLAETTPELIGAFAPSPLDSMETGL
jgi:hypothetical protein